MVPRARPADPCLNFFDQPFDRTDYYKENQEDDAAVDIWHGLEVMRK